MNSSVSKGTAVELLEARFATEVQRVVQELEENQNVVWKSLGNENNSGIVNAQSTEPIACLVELITNSIDATLLRGYSDGGYSDKKVATDVTEAANLFFDSPSEEKIHLVADGTSPQSSESPRDILNLTVIDSGAGQGVNEFEDSFLNLSAPGAKKQEYGFLQGQFGMGSTGVLQFSGRPETESYKFIASASHDDPEKWSWSLVRQNTEGNIMTYQYLTINGEVPTFSGKFGYQNKETDAGQLSFGSFVKVYEYTYDSDDYVSRSKIASEESFLYKLERYLTDIPFTLQLEEFRYKDEKRMDTQGFLSYVEDNCDILESSKIIEDEIDFTDEEYGDQIGSLPVKIVLAGENAREDKSRETNRIAQQKIQKDMAVCFTINGQTHGTERMSFLRSDCGYTNLAEDLVIIVPLDDLPESTPLTDIFDSSRDGLQNTIQVTALRNGLKSYLKENKYLEAQENKRRTSIDIEDADEDYMQELHELLDDDFIEYIENGTLLSFDGYEELQYNPPDVPNMLRVITGKDGDSNYTYWDEKRPYEISLTRNGRTSVDLRLNAPDDYFIGHNSESLQLRSENLSISDYRLETGKLRIRLSDVKNEIAEGIATLQVSRPTSPPLEQEFFFEVNEQRTTTSPDGDGDNVSPDDASPENIPESEEVSSEENENGDTQNDDLSNDDTPDDGDGSDPELPDRKKVPIEDWDSYDKSFDEDTIVRVVEQSKDGGIGDIVFLVNVDCAPVRSFLTGHNFRDSDHEAQFLQRFTDAVAFIGTGMYLQLENDDKLIDGTRESPLPKTEVIEHYMTSIGQLLPPALLSEYELDRLTY